MILIVAGLSPSASSASTKRRIAATSTCVTS